MSEETPPRTRGIGLGIAGQATLMAGWLVGVLGAVGGDEVGLVGVVAGIVGLGLTIVACFLLRARWGVFGPIAGAVLVAGVAGALVAYAAVPATSGWGKLGALILAVMILSGAFVVGHLLAAVGLLRARVTGLGAAALAAEGATVVVLLMSTFAGSELWLFACGGAFVGHALITAGLFVMTRPVRSG